MLIRFDTMFDKDITMYYYDENMTLVSWYSKYNHTFISMFKTLTEVRNLPNIEIIYDSGDD